MKDTITLLERRANRIVEEMGNQARVISGPDEEGYVRIEIEIRHSVDLLSLYHAGQITGLDIAKESRAEMKAA